MHAVPVEGIRTFRTEIQMVVMHHVGSWKSDPSPLEDQPMILAAGLSL